MIYLDHASTTYVYPEIIRAISTALEEYWGNPSNIYQFGTSSKYVIEQSRTNIAQCLNCKPEEIFFTSGASEGNAWAVSQGTICYCSPFEHHNIALNTKSLIMSDKDFISLANNHTEELKSITPAKVVRSHMLVSNETGEIFNLKEDFTVAKENGMFIHCDMTQALGNVEIDFQKDVFNNVDMATFSGHKIHAPKGIGFAYIKKEKQSHVHPLLYGGIQEKSLRAGTENIPYIIGLGMAVEKATKLIEAKSTHCKKLRDAAISRLKYYKDIPFLINEGKNNLNSTLNFSLKNIESEVLQAMLSAQEIYIGTGSACGNGKMELSLTLSEMNVPKEFIHGAIRLSFDLTNNVAEVEKAIDNIIKTYKEITGYEDENDIPN